MEGKVMLQSAIAGAADTGIPDSGIKHDAGELINDMETTCNTGRTESHPEGNMLSHRHCLYGSEPEQLIATMPVDERTKQPHGLLHGGHRWYWQKARPRLVICAVKGTKPVGVEINANHVRAVRSGVVTGYCKAIHLGRNQQVWSIEIF